MATSKAKYLEVCMHISENNNTSKYKVMEKTIYKYPLQNVDEQIIFMPEGAEILSVQTQKETPCLWALVSPLANKTPRNIIIHGTGHTVLALEFGERREYIGTYQSDQFGLVFHVFELISIL